MMIKSLLTEGENILREKGLISFSLDTELLLGKAINQNREYIILNQEKILKKNEYLKFKELISKVASKGGTTEEALKYFSHNQRFESIFVTAINKAEKRSKEISKSYN